MSLSQHLKKPTKTVRFNHLPSTKRFFFHTQSSASFFFFDFVSSLFFLCWFLFVLPYPVIFASLYSYGNRDFLLHDSLRFLFYFRVCRQKKNKQNKPPASPYPLPPPFLATFMRIALDYVRKCLRAAGDVR